MKAILRSDRKVIVDVAPFNTLGGAILWIEKDTHKVYLEEELDWVEYYGG